MCAGEMKAQESLKECGTWVVEQDIGAVLASSLLQNRRANKPSPSVLFQKNPENETDLTQNRTCTEWQGAG